MRSPAAEILETALALQRAPGERFRLRERPLPEGIVHVLEIASGSPQALRAAAAELGQDERELLEAARFYLEQVLFASPDADAYRILGLRQDAPQETVRTHHRWLQRWLHPDRALAGDATVFATRVNQAWAQLRTPELRHEYDVRLAEARLAGASAPLPAATLHRWQQDEAPPPKHGRRSRWLLGAALVACAVLAALIVRHQETIEPWHQPAGQAIAATDPGPAMDDSDVGILAEALTRPDPVEPRPDPVEPSHARLSPPTAPVVEHGSALPVVPMPVVAPKPPRRTPAGTVISSATTVAARATTPPPPPTPLGPPAPLVEPSLARLSPPAVPVAEHGSALQAVTPTAPAVPSQEPAILLERMRQAERRVAQVTAYLAARPGAAPMWNDPQAEAEAARLRDLIKARRGARLELIKPEWRLQRDNASLSADYRCRTATDGVGQGRLDVQLVWREGLWLVRGVDLAPAA